MSNVLNLEDFLDEIELLRGTGMSYEVKTKQELINFCAVLKLMLITQGVVKVTQKKMFKKLNIVKRNVVLGKFNEVDVKYVGDDVINLRVLFGEELLN